jgi:hypothetical protein
MDAVFGEPGGYRQAMRYMYILTVGKVSTCRSSALRAAGLNERSLDLSQYLLGRRKSMEAFPFAIGAHNHCNGNMVVFLDI